MHLRCWLLVWHQHGDLWGWMELGGPGVVLAGGWMVRCLFCRVNRQNKTPNVVLVFFSGPGAGLNQGSKT